MTSNVARRLVLFTVAGAWITFFSPIVIGKNLLNFHVIFYVGYPLAIALAAFMIGDVLKATSMLHRHSAARALRAGAAALAIATLSAVFALDLATTVSNAGPHWKIDNEVREVLSWLEANARKDQVVLTDDLELNLLLSTYTRVRSYVPNGAQSLNSHAEQADRAAVATALLRPPSRDQLIVGTEPPPTFGFPLPSPLYLFHLRYLASDAGPTAFVTSDLEAIRERAAWYDTGGDFKAVSRYRIDYIVVRGTDLRRSVKDTLGLELAFSTGTTRIYSK